MNSENPIIIKIIFLIINILFGIIMFNIFKVKAVKMVKHIIIKNSPKFIDIDTTLLISTILIIKPIIEDTTNAIAYPNILILGITISIYISSNWIKDVINELINIVFCFPKPFKIP